MREHATRSAWELLWRFRQSPPRAAVLNEMKLRPYYRLKRLGSMLEHRLFFNDKIASAGGSRCTSRGGTAGPGPQA
jgi:hypothetical protein